MRKAALSSSTDIAERIQIFLSSAPEDKRLRKSIEQHLSVLQRQGLIQIWHEQQIMVGMVRQHESAKHLQTASIILLLISASFMASGQCWQEMEQAMELAKQGKAQVIPILLGPFSGWQDAPFGKLCVLPNDGKPISQWKQKDLAITSVVDSIRQVIEKKRVEQLSVQLPYTPWNTLIEYPLRPHPNAIRPRKATVEELYARLTQANTNVLALTGIAGAGKSTLADLIYYYTETQRQMGHGPFTAETLKLRINPTVTLVTLLETIFTASGEPTPDTAHLSPHDIAFLLLRFLQSDTGPRLIILDQFEHLLDHIRGEALADDIKAWLHLLSTVPCRCRLLLVSRIIPVITQDNLTSHIHYYHTNGLEMQESIDLLQSWHIDASSTALQTIAENFSGHALALTLLASLLYHQKIQVDTILKAQNPLQFQVEDIAHFIEQLYMHQLDDRQRALLLAFSIFREPMPLQAALAVMSQPEVQVIQHIQPALDSLLILHLLQENNHGYQLHSLIASYAKTHFAPGDPQSNSALRAAAHEKAATYYLQQTQFETIPQPMKHRNALHHAMEAAWHLCQAEHWQKAYAVIVQANIFADLLRWGGSSSLLALYQQLPLDQDVYAEPAQVACIQKELGEIYHRLGNKQKAQSYLMQALVDFKKIGDIKGEAKTLLLLGEVYVALQQQAQAQECYDRTLKLCEENKNLLEDDLKGIALNNIGKIYHEQGQNKQALYYYTEALSLHTTISEEATTLNNLGGLYEHLDEMANAYRHYRKALRFFQEIGDRRGEGSVLHNLARIHDKQGKTSYAQEYYEQAWRVFHEIGDRWSERITLENLCTVYLALEHYKQALNCIVQIKKIAQEMFDEQSYQMKGILFLLQRQFGSARFATLWDELARQNQFSTDFFADN